MPDATMLITGVVQEKDGGAIAGASVYFLSGPVPLPDIAGLTGEDGSFTLSAPAPGMYRIGARAAGYSPGEVEIRVSNQLTSVVIELEKEQQ